MILIIKIINWNLKSVMQVSKTNYNETGQSSVSNPVSLKGKLQTLEVSFNLSISNKSRTSLIN